ncbi:MAG TPA: alpha/beta hydrolase [Ktedonobacteraceae bacterium]|jgi:pimeloyl-ACP methyl ester carboxylesterase|nr:alpha/beta hydrolase [Ktedonobacteraceae bacterium]
MRRKVSVLTAVAVATLATIVGLITSYQAWLRRQRARLQAESSIIGTALGPVEYCMWGQGPAVLVVHGTPGGYDQGFAFSKLVGSQHATFIAISRPGYLRTPLALARTPEEQADLSAAVLDALGIAQTAIIGISGGGPSAIQFALRHPRRCRGLVMISGVAQHYSEQELQANWSPARRLFNRIYSRLVASDFLLYTLFPFARLRPAALQTENLLRSVTLYTLRQVGYHNDMEQFERITTYPLERIAVPTLVVHGCADDEVPFAHAELLAHKVPRVKLLAVADAQHLAFYTHAAIVMPELRAFLASLVD